MEIRAEEHDGDVRFFTEVEIGHFAHVQCIRTYWNSSFIMDVAVGHIQRSTERISSFLICLLYKNIY